MTALLHLPFEPENSQTKSRNKTKKKENNENEPKKISNPVLFLDPLLIQQIPIVWIGCQKTGLQQYHHLLRLLI